MGELEPGTVFAGHRIEIGGRPRRHGRGLQGHAARAGPHGRAEGHRARAARGPDGAARFVRESKVAASIDHPNVIPIYYAGEEGGIAYIAMRYVAGDDIRSLVRREGRARARAGGADRRPDRRRARRRARRRPRAPRHQARQRPAGRRGPRLPDGLRAHQARAVDRRHARSPATGSARSTTSRPSRSAASAIDARADVYALGCLLFFALTGEVPFKRDGDEARLWAHLSEPPPKPSEHGPRPPRGLRRRHRARAGEGPEERYPSAGDLGRAALAAAADRRPAERERLVAKGAAAPVEAPTVTAASRRPETSRDSASS